TPRVSGADPELADLEERLQRALGTQVRIERARRGGRVVIRFYGDEDLDALLERLLGDPGSPNVSRATPAASPGPGSRRAVAQRTRHPCVRADVGMASNMAYSGVDGTILRR